MLHNPPDLYLFKSMSKSSLSFIYKRAYAVVNILKYDNVFKFTASNTTEIDTLEFYFLQSSNKSRYYFVYIRFYGCLKYYKTVHSLSIFLNYVPNEVLYVLTGALLKLLL